MDTLWNKVKKNLVEWYETAYDKTDELARIGKKKVEITGLNRSIEKHFSEMGGRVYDLIVEQGHRGNKTADDEAVQRLVAEVRELENRLRQKEEEIESIKDDRNTDKKGE
jgi:gas vesicle protein